MPLRIMRTMLQPSGNAIFKMALTDRGLHCSTLHKSSVKLLQIVVV